MEFQELASLLNCFNLSSALQKVDHIDFNPKASVLFSLFFVLIWDHM